MSDALAPSNQLAAGKSSGEGLASKPVGRLTVNAAFLREIKDDNRQLKSLWDRLIPMFSHPETAKNHWPELIAGLAELRDQLAIHFSLEEAYGYFDDAVDIAPHLSLTAETLRAQHSTLFSQIRDLAELVLELNCEAGEHINKLTRRFKAFKSSFESHEESELKLILASFDDDLGVGD
ncbi:hemerythrin domain-containing protein [Stieleria sp. ICT_E10.1]|uniref:hemerythrin domain-containing protein n=1 Tax=Stieleria sedimenti TaxID=2976331 RepID=UPI00217F9229|nr:hemerythrin domain-containing protein [Stieleria sedimenti]MCS7468271.1 hemerythrin domain-containing protein [Stieleria sedimenti]